MILQFLMLDSVRDGSVHEFKAVIQVLSAHFDLREAERNLPAKDGLHTQFYKVCQWVLIVLKNIGLIASVRKGLPNY